MGDAYRVQRALVALKIAEGRTVMARKIGLTSRAMQQAISISQVILSGSFTRAVFVHPGDVVHADFGDLGAVTCRFR